MYATKTDGTLWAWGYNEFGQLADNTIISRSSPTQIPGTTWGGTNRLYTGATRYTMSAIKTDGTLWCWANDVEGGLGQNEEKKYSSPVQVPGTNWKQVSIGDDGARTAVKTDGTLWAWGYNGYGNLGLNNQVSYSSPVQIPGSWQSTKSARQRAFAVRSV